MRREEGKEAALVDVREVLVGYCGA